MCQKCKETLAAANPRFIKAMEDHGAELRAVLVKINEAVNAEVVDYAMTHVSPGEKTTREDLAMLLAPRVIGFVVGSSGCSYDAIGQSLDGIDEGAIVGHCYKHARTIN